MLQAALADGTADRELRLRGFRPAAPAGRRYGVVAGIGRIVEALPHFIFGDAGAGRPGSRSDRDARLPGGTTFDGDIDAYPEGELYFPGSPILTITGTFASAVVLETLVLSILNHDCAIASAAARMSSAAGGRPLIEMGSRRTHEEAAVAAARAAYLAGFTATSNLEAGRRYGIPTTGTAAHAFTLLHDTEAAAFAAQSRRSASAPRCWSTPTTSPRASPPRSRWPARARRGPHRLRRPRRADPAGAGSSTALGAPDTGSCCRATSTSTRSPRCAPTGRRVRGRHLAGHRVRRAHRRHGLQAGRGGRPGGGEAQRAEGLPRRAQVGGAATQASPARPPRRSSTGRPSPAPETATSDRVLPVPVVRAGKPSADLPTLRSRARTWRDAAQPALGGTEALVRGRTRS